MYEYVQTDRQDGVFILTLNRPEKLNAINTQMDRDWLHALQEAEADPEVRVVLQQGNGRSFSAGHDLVEVGEILKELGPKASDWNNVYARIWPEGSPAVLAARFPKPIVSAVQGHVAGQAAGLVLQSDIVIAAAGTVFNMEAVRTGGAAGTAQMVGILPPKKVCELVYLGTLTGEDLASCGVVNRVVPPEELHSAALHVAKAIARIHPDSVLNFKKGFNAAMTALAKLVSSGSLENAAASHGNDVDNAFWTLAAEKGVAEALRWRDEEFGRGEFASSKGGSNKR